MGRDRNILHNEERFLLHKIQSLLAQTPQNKVKFKSVITCKKIPVATISPFYHPNAGYVPVVRRLQRADFLNLIECNNTFLCPHCAYRILNKHARIIQGIIDGARRENYVGIMYVLTVPHYKYESSEQVLNKLCGTWATFKRHGSFKRKWKQIAQEIGHVTSLETTYGVNGWHHHYHILAFVPKSQLETIRTNWSLFREHWAKSYEKNSCTYDYPVWQSEYNRMAGYEADPYNVGASLSTNKDGSIRIATVSEYVTGWSSAAEIAKGNDKLHESVSKIPFELADGTPEEQQLFLEYADSVFRKRQRISYTPKLQRRFAEDIAAKHAEAEKKTAEACGKQDTTIAYISYKTWNDILQAEDELDEPIRELILINAFRRGITGIREILLEFSIADPEVYEEIPTISINYDCILG